MRYQESKSLPESYIKPSECCFTLKWFHAIIILVKNFDGMKLFLIGGMEDLNFNYCYKITYESGETYDRRRNELSVEISKEDYKKIITGVLQERPIEQIKGISDVIDKMTENVEFADCFMNKNGSLRKTPLKKKELFQNLNFLFRNMSIGD